MGYKDSPDCHRPQLASSFIDSTYPAPCPLQGAEFETSGPLARKWQLEAPGKDCEHQGTETVGNEEGTSRKSKQRFPSEATCQPEAPLGLPLPISKIKINSEERGSSSQASFNLQP